MVRYTGAVLAIGAFLYGQLPAITSAALEQAPEGNRLERVGSTQTPDSAAIAAEKEATEVQESTRWGSARKTLLTFIVAMENKDYRTAILALDFSSLDPSPDSFEQITYAQRLKACMDRLSLVDATQFSDDPKGAPVPFPPDKPDSEIVVSRGEDGRWRFTADTVAEIDSIYSLLKDQPPLGEEVAIAPEPRKDDGEATGAALAESGDPAAEADVPAGGPVELKSARRTLRSLFDSLENKDYALAVRALDFSALEAKDPEMGPYARLESARRLKEVIERMALIDYAQISDDPDGPTFRFPPDEADQPIEIARDEAQVWRFTANTVSRINALHEAYKDKPILNISDQERPWYDRKLLLGNETWRLLTLLSQCSRVSSWDMSRRLR